MIRLERDPSLGPPANPDGEIVADIIFHRPGTGGPDQNPRSSPTENAGTPREGAGRTPSSKDPSRHSPESDSVRDKKVPSPLSRGEESQPPVRSTIASTPRPTKRVQEAGWIRPTARPDQGPPSTPSTWPGRALRQHYSTHSSRARPRPCSSGPAMSLFCPLRPNRSRT